MKILMQGSLLALVLLKSVSRMDSEPYTNIIYPIGQIQLLVNSEHERMHPYQHAYIKKQDNIMT